MSETDAAAAAAAPTRILGFDPCFLAGAFVTMGDGTTKGIEDVHVGDLVRGAFGETNQVLALHRPLLGPSRMLRINEEHDSVAHNPHISVDKQFYCMDIDTLEDGTYGLDYDVIDASGVIFSNNLQGLRPGRVQLYEVGSITLQTTTGGRLLQSLSFYNLPQTTKLYNLVVSGSHTYCVDGYAVTGWPREDDFNYDTWEPIPQ